MKVTSYGHSCLLLEYPQTRILIDPGNLADDFTGVEGLDAILVTHQHPDHFDPARFATLTTRNPDAAIIVEPSVAAQLNEGSTDAGQVPAKALGAGETTKVGDVTIAGQGGQHAVIHADLPRIGNVGMLLSADAEPTLFHPGDSLEATPSGVDVLAVPVSAPWCAVKETIEFVRAVQPARSIPIHDRVVSAKGRPIYLTHIGNLGGTEVIDFDVGPLTL